MLWDVAKRLCIKLIELTNQDKIRWDQNLDIQEADYEGNKIFVCWSQDGKPELTINDTSVAEYSIGIEELLSEIRGQYRRQDRNGEGSTAEKERQKQENERAIATYAKEMDFQNAANKFLENENKKNKKRR